MHFRCPIVESVDMRFDANVPATAFFLVLVRGLHGCSSARAVHSREGCERRINTRVTPPPPALLACKRTTLGESLAFPALYLPLQLHGRDPRAATTTTDTTATTTTANHRDRDHDCDNDEEEDDHDDNDDDDADADHDSRMRQPQK